MAAYKQRRGCKRGEKLFDCQTQVETVWDPDNEKEKHTEEERDGQAYQEEGNEYEYEREGKMEAGARQPNRGRSGEVEETSRGRNSDRLWLDCLTTFLQWYCAREAL